MMKLRSKRFCRNSFKLGSCAGGKNFKSNEAAERENNGDIKWEVRPGGMLVQKRETVESLVDGIITIKISTVLVSHWQDVSIEATSTFGELKMILAMVSGLEPREQRLVFKGKEREDGEYLHMVGVRDRDKVLLLQDPAIKERKLHALSGRQQPIHTTCRFISV